MFLLHGDRYDQKRRLCQSSTFIVQCLKIVLVFLTSTYGVQNRQRGPLEMCTVCQIVWLFQMVIYNTYTKIYENLIAIFTYILTVNGQPDALSSLFQYHTSLNTNYNTHLAVTRHRRKYMFIQFLTSVHGPILYSQNLY